MSCPEHLLLFALRACFGAPRRRMASELHAAHWESVAELAVETALSFQVLQAGDVTAIDQASPSLN